MRFLSRFLWLLVGLGLALYFILTVWIGFLGLAYPYQLDYGEGIVLWFSQQLAHGYSIYKGLTGLPYASSNYPPLSMFLPAVLMPLLGEGYVAGRLLNFASALLVAALIFKIVRAETRDWRLGALAGLLFIGSPYIYHWAPLFRADLIGLFFAFAGVYAVWAWERKAVSSKQYAVSRGAGERGSGGAEEQRPVTSDQLPVIESPNHRITESPSSLSPVTRHWSLVTRHWLLASAFVFFLLTLYTKQSLFAAPAAACLSLFMRDRRLAFGFAFCLGLAGGALYLVMDWATAGGFTFGIITSNATVFLYGQLWQMLRSFAATFPILLLLAAWEWLNRLRARRVGVLEWYGLISLGVIVLAGRIGASENYFFEAIASMAVFAGMAIARIGKQIAEDRGQRIEDRGQTTEDRRQRIGVLSTVFRYAVLPLVLLVQLGLMWHDPRVALDLVTQGLPANKQLESLLARTSGSVISEDMGALTTSGKGVSYYTFQYSSLARSGKWDQSWELNGLSQGLFPLVILQQGTREDVDHYSRFTREFVSTLDRYYAQTASIGIYRVYAPAPPLKLARADFGDDLALVGWSANTETLQPGSLHVSIVWQAKRAMTGAFTAFVHLETAAGDIVTQDDHAPLHGVYPTYRWAANEMVRDQYVLQVPDDLKPGQYALWIGWYDSSTQDRLSVTGSPDDMVKLATFDVPGQVSTCVKCENVNTSK